jgi:hypothetical protein
MKAFQILLLIVGVGAVQVSANPLELGSSAVGGKSHQGEEITADLPLDQMMWNIGSKVDGFGMCVATSIEQAARYQGIEQFRGFREWCARFPGGAWPQKMDQQIAAYAKERGIPVPSYLQYTGDDSAELRELLETIDRTGRLAAIAYGYSPRYGGPINHMVFSPKCGSGKWACIVDNNAVGGVRGEESARYEWMSRDELEDRMRTQAGSFGRTVKSNPWVFVWLASPPPPPPTN